MNGQADAVGLLQAEAVERSDTIASLVVSRGAVVQTGAILCQTIGNRPVLIVADDNTWAAAGPAVEAALRAEGLAARRHVLPAVPRVKPTRELGDALSALIEGDEVFVAVGSGVLNDVTKYAAFARDQPYLCVATAASMDGYTSAGAPLSDRGFKKTIQCRPPSAVIADLDIIAAAPPEMIGWGYGDMAGKVPAGADWIVADALGIEPLDDVAWPMVQDHLRTWLAEPDALARGDREAIAGLFAGLSLVGLAMEAHGSSRPASGADHQIAHLWEMEGLEHGGERVSHGACVSVGCMAVLRLYDWLLRQDLGALQIEAILAAAPDMAARRAEIEARLAAGEVADRAMAETEAKHASPAEHRARLDTLTRIWPELRARLRTQLIAPAEMADMLARVGAPAAPEEIGVSAQRLRDTVAASRFLRSRYTLLDLLDETGLLEPALDTVFGPGARP